MKQFEFEYTSYTDLENELRKISLWCKSTTVSNIVFHIFTENMNNNKINHIKTNILDVFPEAKYIGCSTNGNIYNGAFSNNDIIVCTVFEYVTTKVEVLQYELTDNTTETIVNDLCTFINTNSWVKSIEFLTTIRGMSMTRFCNKLSTLRNDIAIFGGGAFTQDIYDNTAYVFSNYCEPKDHSIVFLLIGGEDFHVSTSYVTGWKPLGRTLRVTKSNENNIIELDNKPAYETYYKYLKIKNDRFFFKNTLEFPLLYHYHGIDVLRDTVACLEDGTFVMVSDIEENSTVKIAYGDPWTIIANIKQEAQKYVDFQPEAIAIFSCGGRRAFWGDKDVSKEIIPFQQVASTYGFYTSSEFHRTNEWVMQHNVTEVIAAMREGKKNPNGNTISIYTEDEISSGATMVNRLTNFIQASTEELEEMVEKLANISITDGMTGLYNRTEIQRQIIEDLDNRKDTNMCLIMLDIDNFKKINDTYGHKEGDNVIIALANMMKKKSNQYSKSNSIGRWGGEEFMILCPNTTIEQANTIAEYIRSDFEQLEFEKASHCTISLGVTKLLETDSADNICQRVDKALYEAKTTGKNKTVVL